MSIRHNHAGYGFVTKALLLVVACLTVSSCAVPWENLTRNPRVPQVETATDTTAVSWYDTTCLTTTQLRKVSEQPPVQPNQTPEQTVNRTVAYYTDNEKAFGAASERFRKLADSLPDDHDAVESAQQLRDLLTGQQKLYERLLSEVEPLRKNPEKASQYIESNSTRLARVNKAFTDRWSQLVYSVKIPNKATSEAVNALPSCVGILHSSAPDETTQPVAPGFY